MEWNLLALGYDNYTNYIKLPQSILAEFNKSDDNIEVQVLDSKKRKSIMDEYEKSPFYFCIESSIDTFCYCGVQDFTADEGLVYLPNHLLDQLAINGCDVVTVKYINNVPKGEFVVIEPLNKEIFDIKDLDKYLEKVISGYCVLYQNQVINFEHENNFYKILIKKIKAVDDIETNLIDVVNTDLFFDIHNKFLEEELRQKELEKLKMKEQKELEEVLGIEPEQIISPEQQIEQEASGLSIQESLQGNIQIQQVRELVGKDGLRDVELVAAFPELQLFSNFMEDVYRVFNKYSDVRNFSNQDVQKALKKIDDVRTIAISIQNLTTVSGAINLADRFLAGKISKFIKMISKIIDPKKIVPFLKTIIEFLETVMFGQNF